MTRAARWSVLVRHDGEHWYISADNHRYVGVTTVLWMCATRAEAVAVGRWLARGLAPSELLIHRRDGSLLPTATLVFAQECVAGASGSGARYAGADTETSSVASLLDGDLTKPF